MIVRWVFESSLFEHSVLAPHNYIASSWIMNIFELNEFDGKLVMCQHCAVEVRVLWYAVSNNYNFWSVVYQSSLALTHPKREVGCRWESCLQFNTAAY